VIFIRDISNDMNVSNYVWQREPFLGGFKLEAVAGNTNYIYKNFKPFLNKEVWKI
jgi:hypothetical protein